MNIQNKEINLRFDLAEGETAKIDINGNKEFEETVSAGKSGKLTIKFQEALPG